MLNRFRRNIEKYINTIALTLAKTGVKPWSISLTGLIIIILASIWLVYGPAPNPLAISILLFIVGNLMDALDGPLARATNQVTRWGSYIDSMIDRLGEAIYILALGYTGIVRWDLAYIYIATSILISYSRSKGESVGVDMAGVGLMERAERIIGISAILVLYMLIGLDTLLPLTIIITLNIITIFQRSIHIYSSLRRS